jgi:hypothetical protein
VKLYLSMICVALVAFFPSALRGQATATPASTAPASSQGSEPIESQIIAYRALGKIAAYLAPRIAKDICNQASPCNTPTTLLLADANSLFEIASYVSFNKASSLLINQYQAVTPGIVHPNEFSDSTTAVASLITAIKSSAVYTNQNFQPTTQSFTTLLSQDLKHQKIAVRNSAIPGDQTEAEQYIQDALKSVFDAQKKADPKARAAVDTQFTAFQTALMGTSPDGTVLISALKGRALSHSLGQNYDTLTISLDAAGGDSKVTHIGLYEILFPTPNPSYNGGAAVSFTLTDGIGTLIDGDMLAGMYSFTKLKSPSLSQNDREVDPAAPISMVIK